MLSPTRALLPSLLAGPARPRSPANAPALPAQPCRPAPRALRPLTRGPRLAALSPPRRNRPASTAVILAEDFAGLPTSGAHANAIRRPISNARSPLHLVSYSSAAQTLAPQPPRYLRVGAGAYAAAFPVLLGAPTTASRRRSSARSPRASPSTQPPTSAPLPRGGAPPIDARPPCCRGSISAPPHSLPYASPDLRAAVTNLPAPLFPSACPCPVRDFSPARP